MRGGWCGCCTASRGRSISAAQRGRGHSIRTSIGCTRWTSSRRSSRTQDHRIRAQVARPRHPRRLRPADHGIIAGRPRPAAATYGQVLGARPASVHLPNPPRTLYGDSLVAVTISSPLVRCACTRRNWTFSSCPSRPAFRPRRVSPGRTLPRCFVEPSGRPAPIAAATPRAHGRPFTLRSMRLARCLRDRSTGRHADV